jgi:putative SOS response-associated peptidase YedK
MSGEPETLWGSAAKLFRPRPRDNHFRPSELRPKSRNYVVREEAGERAWDVMTWDVTGGKAPWPMTNVRNLTLKQWRAFCEFTPEAHDLDDGKKPLKGEMWFAVPDLPVFPVAGFWQHTEAGDSFAMVTCDPNPLVAPIHPKAMITILDPADVDTWLRGSYDDVVKLQRPFDPDRMTVRGPVFPTRNKATG